MVEIRKCFLLINQRFTLFLQGFWLPLLGLFTGVGIDTFHHHYQVCPRCGNVSTIFPRSHIR